MPHVIINVLEELQCIWRKYFSLCCGNNSIQRRAEMACLSSGLTEGLKHFISKRKKKGLKKGLKHFTSKRKKKNHLKTVLLLFFCYVPILLYPITKNSDYRHLGSHHFDKVFLQIIPSKTEWFPNLGFHLTEIPAHRVVYKFF